MPKGRPYVVEAQLCVSVSSEFTRRAAGADLPIPGVDSPPSTLPLLNVLGRAPRVLPVQTRRLRPLDRDAQQREGGFWLAVVTVVRAQENADLDVLEGVAVHYLEHLGLNVVDEAGCVDAPLRGLWFPFGTVPGGDG